MSAAKENILEKGPEEPDVSLDPTASERREATEAEIRDLPHIIDHVPLVAWTAALIGAAERFGYYSTVITWRKYTFEVVRLVITIELNPRLR
jgi:POT family proton-dependent oligopeptide transporter